MVSTFSLPESVVAPNGDKALYDCPASTSTGAYAQCDGGLCFTSTKGQSFPGFAEPLNEGQVICSCPTVVANPATALTGYQIAGPYPCEPSFFANCDSTTRQHQHRLADLCRRPDRVGPLADPLALWSGPALEQMPSQ